MRVSFCVLGIHLSLFSYSSAQEVDTFLELPEHKIEQISKKGNIKVGDRIRFRIVSEELKGRTELEFRLPEGSSTLLKQGWMQTQAIENLIFELSPLQSGHLTLSPMIIVTKKEEPLARTAPFHLQIRGQVDGEKEPTMYPPVGFEFPIVTVVLLSILAFLILGAGIYWAAKYFGKLSSSPQLNRPQAPPIPEHEVAIRALRSLNEQRHWESGAHKVHYFGISDIMKEYLGKRYGFDAIESTSDELIDELKAKAVSADVIEAISKLYEQLDLIKFTNRVPESSEPQDVMTLASQMIDRTKRVESVVNVESSDKKASSG